MKKLAEIIRKSSELTIVGDEQVEIRDFCLDSRQAIEGSLFVAKKGLLYDGHLFIISAIANGAQCILCEYMPEEFSHGVCYVITAKLNLVLSELLNEFYEYPSNEIILIGITGTNGKTTTASLLFEMFESLGYKCGLISTVQNRIHEVTYESTHTTPDIVSLYKMIYQMKIQGCSHVFMEVSSHAIDQERILGLNYTGGVFTNITHDHLDYHHTFKNYINAKKKFFDILSKDAFALFNMDDVNGAIMVQNTLARKLSYGILNMADYKAKILDNNLYGLQLKINQHEIHTRLIGEFNAYNLLAVYAVADQLGIHIDEILLQLSTLHSVEGRFDWIQNGSNKKIGIVDYAHTPDALEKILQTLRKIKSPKQSIITVVGCGGNRDKSKRPKMAVIAVELSEKVIFTADNPRDEDPEEIIKEMEAGVVNLNSHKHISITDREQAIKTACLLSNFSDIILVAGKGHEKYQEIKGKKFPFDDKEKLKTFLLN
ncbi:MAG: UDP-N-acetylmuramoyl-L-alanyl-D-glutamate--2,6-diaminopimelate ligase [Saprospiraceae bacterium]